MKELSWPSDIDGIDVESPSCAESTTAEESVTALLRELGTEGPEALDRLMPLVYEELRGMAHKKLRFERSNHTLNTTALVHEAYLRLADQRWAELQDRGHFFAIAAQAMRRILVSYARKHHAVKRGGDAVRVPMQDAAEGLAEFAPEHAHELLALDDALTRLEAFNERGCRVVEYRFFGGMTHEEVAQVMDLSTVTVRRSWSLARAWLRRELAESISFDER